MKWEKPTEERGRGQPAKLTIAQKMELRRAFRPIRYGQKCRWYQEQAQKYGCCGRVIQQAVLG
jgi:hypothetical protein